MVAVSTPEIEGVPNFVEINHEVVDVVAVDDDVLVGGVGVSGRLAGFPGKDHKGPNVGARFDGDATEEIKDGLNVIAAFFVVADGPGLWTLEMHVNKQVSKQGGCSYIIIMEIPDFGIF